MLYQQLIRVNEIDTEIATLHQSLMGLYAERATLVQAGTDQASALPLSEKAETANKPTDWNAESSYAALQKAWNIHNVKLPSFKTLRRKLEKACNVAKQLESDSVELRGKLSFVAVPPSHTLEKVLHTKNQERSVLPAMDADLLAGLSKTKGWSLLLIMDISLGIQVYGLQAFLASQDYVHDNYDCRGLGLSELVAAELQGVKAVAEDGWTLLLKDHQPTAPVLCAQYVEGRIMLDTDDADCLLDDNYLQPAIHVA